jgi:hypothetical protein
MSKVPTLFNWRARLAEAQASLALPPTIAHIERPAPRGEVVARFVLPLELCQPFNRLSRAGTASAGFALGKLKTGAYTLMLVQLGGKLPQTPLEGRPQILCCRFSSKETDAETGWCKNPVDRLRIGKNGLGFIVDDAPRFVEVRAWWESAKAKEGFVYLEIRN